MNAPIERSLTFVGIYVLVLGASVLTGMVTTGQADISQWSPKVRNATASAPLGIVILMLLFGIV